LIFGEISFGLKSENDNGRFNYKKSCSCVSARMRANVQLFIGGEGVTK